MRTGSATLMLLGCLALACNGGGGGSTATDDDGGPDGGPEGVSLDPGDVLILEPGGDGAFAVEIETAAGDERYVLLLISESRQHHKTWSYEVSVNGATLAQPEQSGPLGRDTKSLTPALPHGLREAQEALAAGAKAAGPRRSDPPEIGDLLPFTIKGDASYEEIECEVMNVTSDLVIVFDRTTTFDLSIDEDILATVAENFASIVLPRMRVYFGEESDVNGDGRVTLLYSPLVFTGSGGATAYVFPCDLLAAGSSGCPYSNEQELIYMSPPDLLSSHMGTANAITETLAHEFQHAIYFFRKFVQSGQETAHESLYITEGMSAMAQDQSGFQAGNLYVAAAAIENVDDISMAGILGWPMGYNQQHDGVWRGAAYLFIRYLFEQAGGEAMDDDGNIDDLGGVTFLNDMTDLPLYGYDGVEAAAGMTAEELIAGMFTAMLLDDRELDGALLTSDTAFAFQDPWTDPVTGRQRGITMNYDLAGGSWKVRGVSLQLGGADGSIRSGGAEYLLIEAKEDGGYLAIEAGAEDSAELAARLVRIR